MSRWDRYEQDDEQVCTGSPRAGDPDGAGSQAGLSVPLGNGGIDCREDRRLAATLHEWVKKAEVGSGKRAGVPTEVADKEILRKASAYFAQAELDRPFRR